MKLNTMALVSCPECQHEVSALALACPQCAYPYPGKHGASEKKLQTCTECGGVISKKAESCPHCGISCANASESTPVREETKEESWLCTHCGTPYTRKVRIPARSIPHAETQQYDHHDPPVIEEQEIRKTIEPILRAENQKTNTLQPPVAEKQDMSFLQKMDSASLLASRHPAGRHASPLWLPSSPSQDQTSSSSRPRKKFTIIMGIILVLVLLIALSIILWGIWEPNGTNLLDVFGIPTWSMNNESPTVPQGAP